MLGLLGGCAGISPREVREMGRDGNTAGLLEAWRDAERDGIRLAVIKAFSQNPEDGAGRELILGQAVSHRNTEVRLAALRALGVYPQPEVIPPLVQALADPQPAVRELARSVLAAKGAAAQGALLEAALTHPSPLARASAVRLVVGNALAHPELQAPVERVLERAARGDEAAKVREAAVKGIGKLDAGWARTLLRDLCQTDGDPAVRIAAAAALQKITALEPPPRVVVAVLPLKNDTGSADPEILRLGAQIAEYLATRLAQAKVCQVVDRAKLAVALAEMKKIGAPLYDGQAPNAPELGRFQLANQLVYGTIQRQGLVYTILLNRMEVSTLTLIPGSSATVSGYREDLERLKVKLADAFLANFR